MTLLVEKGTFAKTTSTSVPVDQTVTLSNGSLTPKLVILWTDSQTTTDGTYRDDSTLSYGFSDGTNDACQAYRCDESAETEAYTFHNNAVIAIISLTTGSIVSQGDISAFNAGNFHINWSVQSDTNALQIHYLVAGGTDITNVSCVSTTVGTTGTGNTSFTGSGTTFTPDFALTMTGADSYTTANAITSGSDDALFCIGAARSTSKRWVMYGRDETFGTSDCDMYLDPSACLAAASVSDGSVTFLADFVSFDSATGGGITVNISNGADATTKKLAFLFVKGASWDCGAFQQRNGTGTQDVTIATGIDPALVFLGGINTASSATVTANNYIGIGASDGTNEGACFAGNTNGLGTYAAVNSNIHTKVYRMSTPNATATSSTTNAECDMTGMSTAGQFTLDWTTADSTQRQMVYWVLGAVTQSNIEKTLEETVSISDSVARTVGKTRALSTETVTIGESLVRLAAKTRTISDTVTIGETLNRLAAKNRALATETVTIADDVDIVVASNVTRTLEENVNVSDSVSRMAAKTRTLNETVSSSENLARQTTKNRSLATESVTVSDSVTRLKGAMRSLATETVSISDSVVRQCNKIRAIIENVVIGDTLTRLAAKTRALATEVVAVADNVAQLKESGGVVRTLIETVNVSDSVARQCNKIRTIVETTTISDVVTFVNSNTPAEVVRFFTGAGAGGRLIKRFRLKRRSFKLFP